MEYTYARARADHAVCSRLPSPHSAKCARTSPRTIYITTTIIIAFASAHPSRASHTIAVPTSIFFLPIYIHVCIYAESSLDTITRDLRVFITSNIDNGAPRGTRTAPHTASDTRFTHTSASGRASTTVFSRARSRRNVTTLHAWA